MNILLKMKFTTLCFFLFFSTAVFASEDYRIRIHEAGQLTELSCKVAANTKSFQIGDWNLQHTTMYGRDSNSAVTMEVYEKAQQQTFPNNLEWVAANKSCLPQKNPVYGGKDATGAPMYICQFKNQSTHFIGWVSPKDGVCTSADHDDYQHSDNYDVLINPRQLKLGWVKPGGYNYNFVPPNAVRALADAQQYIGRVQKRFEEVHVIGKIFSDPSARRYLEDLDYFTAVKGSLEFLTVLKS